MVLKVKLASGEVHEVPFDSTSTLQVTNQTVIDGVPASKVDAWSEISDVWLDDDAEPAPQPTIETLTPEQAAAAAAGDTSTTASPSAGHDEAVAAAQTAIADAPMADQPVDHIAAALADVETALGIWPDSAELADAKAQLEAQQAAAAGSGS